MDCPWGRGQVNTHVSFGDGFIESTFEQFDRNRIQDQKRKFVFQRRYAGRRPDIRIIKILEISWLDQFSHLKRRQG